MSSSEILEKVDNIFNLNEFGGSVTIFIEFCNIESGKLSDGSVVKNNLNAGLYFLFNS